jgi:4-hydroxy-2-oxoheptanedioate aldolase
MKLKPNLFKKALKEGRSQLGLWSTLANNIVADVLSDAGYDWIAIDMEHAPNEIPTVLSQLQAMNGGTATPIVRLPWNDPVVAKQVLDIGAYTLVFPMVQNAEDAERAVATTRYPPRGIRGVALGQRGSRYGRVSDYAESVEQEICIVAQIETADAMGRLEEIASVDGIDAVFFGPADLSADMGHFGKPGNPETMKLMMDGLETCKRIGIPVGILTSPEDVTLKCLKAGFAFVAIGSDTGLLARQSEALLDRIKNGNTL